MPESTKIALLIDPSRQFTRGILSGIAEYARLQGFWTFYRPLEYRDRTAEHRLPAVLKKLKPDVEIVDQQWPKLGEADYAPFINAQLAKRPEVVFSSLWGGHFVTFIKQAKPLGFFDSIKNNFIAAGEAGSIESAKATFRARPTLHAATSSATGAW